MMKLGAKSFLTVTAISIAACVSPAASSAKTATVTSPDRQICVTVDDNGGKIHYSITRAGADVILPSEIGLEITGAGKPAAKIGRTKTTRNVRERFEAPVYRRDTVDVTYNQIDLALGSGLTLRLRAFDNGVAYRFICSGPATIGGETAEFRFPGDPEVWLPYSTNDEKPMAMAYQALYHDTPLSHAKDKLAFLPVTASLGNGVKLTILESDLEAYPGMFVKADTTACALRGVFAPYPAETAYYPWRKQLYVTGAEQFIARSETARAYPWRILAITGADTEMPYNDLVYALASPNRISDTGWIKPGKAAWDWWNDWGLIGVPFKAGINTATYKHYIDFAADNGLEYVILDEGWYDPASGDMLTTIADIDLPELIAYAGKRNVGIVLWTVFNVLDAQLEEACGKYAAMGVKGFKVDFLDRDDQTAVEMTYRIAEAAARHHLLLDYHGIYKPTGINRTYPNVLNFEGVFGMEEARWTEPESDMPLYDVTFPYIRMMAGPVDYTPGAMRNASRDDWKAVYRSPMSMGTRCHQLATYIVHDSPFTMLCDSPSNYRREQESTDFIAGLPDRYASSAAIAGELGKFIVSARATADGRWFVGGLTDWNARDVTVDFSFLPADTEFTATIFTDGVNADKHAEDYSRHTVTVDSSTRMPVHMAPGGGFAMRIDPKH